MATIRKSKIVCFAIKAMRLKQRVKRKRKIGEEGKSEILLANSKWDIKRATLNGFASVLLREREKKVVSCNRRVAEVGFFCNFVQSLKLVEWRISSSSSCFFSFLWWVCGLSTLIRTLLCCFLLPFVWRWLYTIFLRWHTLLNAWRFNSFAHCLIIDGDQN